MGVFDNRVMRLEEKGRLTPPCFATKRSGMPDLSLRRWLDAPLAHVAARAAALGLSAVVLLTAGLLLGLAALPSIALGHPWLGLACIALSRALALIGAAGARDLAPRLSAIFWASLPFAFALADPSRALAAAFALFGFVAFVSVKRIEAMEEIVGTLAFAAACVFANGFSLIAYALGIACFIVAGIRLARDPA